LNKEKLQERIDTINNQMQVIKANYAQLEGHLAEANHWLNELNVKNSDIIQDEIIVCDTDC